MNIKFNLKFKDGSIFFGNLGINSTEPEQYSLGDEFHYNSEMLARLIAHDALEHTTAHSSNTSVTYVDEFKALGAVLFMRPNQSIKSDIISMVQYLKPWSLPEIKSPNINIPITIHEVVDAITEGINDEVVNKSVLVSKYSARIYSYLKYGYWNASKKYQDQPHAQSVFYELESYMKYFFDHEFNYLEDFNIIYFSYDTENYNVLFNPRMKNF